MKCLKQEQIYNVFNLVDLFIYVFRPLADIHLLLSYKNKTSYLILI